MTEMSPGRSYVALVPVKPPAVGKSRLAAYDDVARRALAAAFAQDTVRACLEARRVGAVLVVTDDAPFSTALTALGAVAIPDGVSGDLNGTLRQAAAEARRRWPDLVPVAICADLPALRATDLDAVLGAAPADRACFVPDAAGVGTTLYAAPHDEFDPCFGGPSREAHLDSGAREIADAPPSLRRDVDEPADLTEAAAIGVGASTAAVLAAT